VTSSTVPKTQLAPGTFLAPVPAVLVSCAAPGKRPNIISLAWVGTMCSDPPVIAIGVRPSRHSYELIKAAGDFVVNLPSASQAPLVDYCGTHSGRDIDKFASCNLDAVPSTVVSSPAIGQCPVNLECKLLRVVPLGSHDVFFGEVVAVTADSNVLNDRGGVDPQKADLIAFAGGAYWSLHQPVPRRS